MNSKPVIRVTLKYNPDTDSWDSIAHGSPTDSLTAVSTADVATKIGEMAQNRADGVKTALEARRAKKEPFGKGDKGGVVSAHQRPSN